MFPQIKQIQRFVVDAQDEQEESGVVVGVENGIVREDEEDDAGWEESKFCEYRHTGHRLSPHLLRHMQWNVCEHGTVMRPVTAESMRSRQTGHVGSSEEGAWPVAMREMDWET